MCLYFYNNITHFNIVIFIRLEKLFCEVYSPSLVTCTASWGKLSTRRYTLLNTTMSTVFVMSLKESQ